MQVLLPGWLWAPMDLATELPELPWRPWNTSIPQCGEWGGVHTVAMAHQARPVFCSVDMPCYVPGPYESNKCRYFVSIMWLGKTLF
jgi:hypothetical protein